MSIKISLSTCSDFIGSLSDDDRLSLYFGKGHTGNLNYHVRGIVDNQVVVKRWLKNRGRWQYECLGASWLIANSDHLTLVKLKGQ